MAEYCLSGLEIEEIGIDKEGRLIFIDTGEYVPCKYLRQLTPPRTQTLSESDIPQYLLNSVKKDPRINAVMFEQGVYERSDSNRPRVLPPNLGNKEASGFISNHDSIPSCIGVVFYHLKQSND